MYLTHKAAYDGAVGNPVATNPMREDDQRVLSSTLSNRSVLQHTWVLDDSDDFAWRILTKMTLPSMYCCLQDWAAQLSAGEYRNTWLCVSLFCPGASKQAPSVGFSSLNCVYRHSIYAAEHASNSL